MPDIFQVISQMVVLPEVQLTECYLSEKIDKQLFISILHQESVY